MQDTFDPYAPPKTELLRTPEQTPPREWVYPLTIECSPSWLVKLGAELRDALGQVILGASFRYQLWELYGFRLLHDERTWAQGVPRRFYASEVSLRDGGDEIAKIKAGPPLRPWTAEAPGGLWVQVRHSNPFTRWREGYKALPPLASVGDQLAGLKPKGYPILTVHAGRSEPAFLVVRRSFEGALQSTRVERLEGQVKPEVEWLGLQLLLAAFIHRLPGIG